MKPIFILVPCYNEKAVIRKTILDLHQRDYQIIVVDDGSTQDIWSEIKDIPLYYLRHSINLSQGAALQTGMDFALAKKAKIVVHFDADGQHDAKNIPSLIQPILNNECDITIGSRFIKGGKTIGMPLSRRVILQLGRIFNKIFTGFWFTDAHNGFRAMNRKTLQKIKLKENRMAYATEILQQIKREKLVIKEVPVHITYSDYSKSKGQSNWNAINILIDMTIRKLL